MTRQREKAKLDQLCMITEMAWVVSSQGLRDCVAAERAVSAKLIGLAESKRSNLALLYGAEHADASVIRSVSSWLRWSERERQRLNLDLARHRAALAAEQAKARKAFGRREAARKLRERG